MRNTLQCLAIPTALKISGTSNLCSPVLNDEPCKSALVPDNVLVLSFHWAVKHAGSEKTLHKSPVLQLLRKEHFLTCERTPCFACTQLKELLRYSTMGLMLSQTWTSPRESTCFVSVLLFPAPSCCARGFGHQHLNKGSLQDWLFWQWTTRVHARPSGESTDHQGAVTNILWNTPAGFEQGFWALPPLPGF